VESEINSLEHHGLNRLPDVGLPAICGMWLGVMSYNLHVIGRSCWRGNGARRDRAAGSLKAAHLKAKPSPTGVVSLAPENFGCVGVPRAKSAVHRLTAASTFAPLPKQEFSADTP